MFFSSCNSRSHFWHSATTGEEESYLLFKKSGSFDKIQSGDTFGPMECGSSNRTWASRQLGEKTTEMLRLYCEMQYNKIQGELKDMTVATLLIALNHGFAMNIF